MGLSTDTGNFLFDNVTSETLRIAADLIDCGADANSLRWYMYESCSHKRIELMKYILNDLHISYNGKYPGASQLTNDAAAVSGQHRY